MNHPGPSRRNETPSRRSFLMLTGAGALGLAGAVPPALAAPQTAAKPAAKPKGGSKREPPPPPKKYPLALGLASYSLRKFSLDETIAMTKRVGLEYLCLKSMHLPLEASSAEIAAAVKKVADAGLVLYGGGVISMRNPKEVDQAFEYAKAAGMHTIVGVPMPEVLQLVNEKVQKYNILVAIHNHGPGDKVYPTPATIIEKIRTLDRRIGLCIDIGHTLRIGADPIADAERYADRLHDVHIKDVTAATPKGYGIQVGRGVIDIPRFLRTLKKINYAGAVSFEYEEDADDPLPGLAESVGYTRGVMATM